jgi:hypothetical protein
MSAHRGSYTPGVRFMNLSAITMITMPFRGVVVSAFLS